MAKASKKSAKKAAKKAPKKAVKKAAKKSPAKASKKASKPTKKAPAKAGKKAARKASKIIKGTWQLVCKEHGILGTYPSEASANIAHERHRQLFPDDEVRVLGGR